MNNREDVDFSAKLVEDISNNRMLLREACESMISSIDTYHDVHKPKTIFHTLRLLCQSILSCLDSLDW